LVRRNNRIVQLQAHYFEQESNMRNDTLPVHDPGGLGIFDLMAKGLVPPAFRPTSDDGGDRHDSPNSTKAEPAPPPRRRLLHRLERWFWARRQRDLEAYLAQSTDVHDLEARIRELERDPLHPYF